MVNAGHAFKGSRVGADRRSAPLGRQLEAERNTKADDRTLVSYWCIEGHETRPIFAKLKDSEIPDIWQCGRCGRPAGRSPGADLLLDNDEPFKSHLQYAKERRSEAEALQVLEDALNKLRSTRKP